MTTDKARRISKLKKSLQDAETRGFYQGYACCLATYMKEMGCDAMARELWSAGIGTWDRLIEHKIDEYDMTTFTKYKDQLCN